ncbi:MAG TPA: glycogen-binding domain-containing protein [Verrucomicrobiae bacterium]|jgi:1,4-alpha-glucan branching enzyme
MSKKKSGKNAAPKIEQLFLLNAPTAQDVQLAGNFTQWEKSAIAMSKNDNGIWQAAVAMQPGEYQYRFLVDGEWWDDEECASYSPNPFGSRNAVRQVT